MGLATPLWGRSVLVVEDEPLIALDVLEILSRAGASVIAARSVEEALRIIISAEVCAAILDIDLGGDDCATVCASLAVRKIPFLFYTGYANARLPTSCARAPVINKPAVPHHILSEVTNLIGGEQQIGRCG